MPASEDHLSQKINTPETPTKRDQGFRKHGLIGFISGLMDLGFNVEKVEESSERAFQYSKGHCKEK